MPFDIKTKQTYEVPVFKRSGNLTNEVRRVKRTGITYTIKTNPRELEAVNAFFQKLTDDTIEGGKFRYSLPDGETSKYVDFKYSDSKVEGAVVGIEATIFVDDAFAEKFQAWLKEKGFEKLIQTTPTPAKLPEPQKPTAIEELYATLFEQEAGGVVAGDVRGAHLDIGFILTYDETNGYDVVVYPTNPEENFDVAATVQFNEDGSLKSRTLATMKAQLIAAPKFSGMLTAANEARKAAGTSEAERVVFEKLEKAGYKAAQANYIDALDYEVRERKITEEKAKTKLKFFEGIAFAKFKTKEPTATPLEPRKPNAIPKKRTRLANLTRMFSGTPPDARKKGKPKSTLGGGGSDSEDEVFLDEKKSRGSSDEVTDEATPHGGSLKVPRTASESEVASGKLTIPKSTPSTAGQLTIPKRKPKPFPASPYPAGSHNLRVITWTRSYYGLGEGHNKYPLTFAKARTVQTDSNEYMKFFGQFLSEINTQRGNVPVPSKADLQAALYDIQNTEIVYPYNSLKEVLLRSHDPGDTETTKGTKRPDSLYDYIHWIRLNQYARNSFPFGFEAEDSEYFSTRLNKLGWGSRPRAEMESSLQNAILFYGVGMRKDDDKGNYTITQQDDDGTVRDIIKARVAENGGMVTFELQPGIDDKDKESAIRKLLIMHESHIQQNCSNIFEAKLGSNIYDNIRMLQLALYDFNFNVTFKGLNSDEAQQKMFAQIDALKLDPAEDQKLKDEVLFLVSNAQTFDTTITHGGSKEMLQTAYIIPEKTLKKLTPEQRDYLEKAGVPLEPLAILTPNQVNAVRAARVSLEPLSLSKTQELLLARSAKVVNTIFAPMPEKPAPTTKPTQREEGLAKSFLSSAKHKMGIGP